MVTVTRKAAGKIRASIDRAGAPGLCLRLAAKRLADGTFDYAMGLDQPGQHDTRAASNGVEVIIAPTSAEFLRGATLDYVEWEPGEHRFIFMNPNDPGYVPPTD